MKTSALSQLMSTDPHRSHGRRSRKSCASSRVRASPATCGEPRSGSAVMYPPYRAPPSPQDRAGLEPLVLVLVGRPLDEHRGGGLRGGGRGALAPPVRGPL